MAPRLRMRALGQICPRARQGQRTDLSDIRETLPESPKDYHAMDESLKESLPEGTGGERFRKVCPNLTGLPLVRKVCHTKNLRKLCLMFPVEESLPEPGGATNRLTRTPFGKICPNGSRITTLRLTRTPLRKVCLNGPRAPDAPYESPAMPRIGA